jgi:hypothetical protein
MSKYPNTLGRIEAVWNILGGEAGVDALLRGEIEIRSKPLPFPKNEHGHYIIEVTGLNLSGVEEITRLESGGFRVGDYAKSMLTSTNSDSYDVLHRLEDGKVYKMVLVPGREVKKNRTTTNLQAYGSQFGYQKPLAGIQPRIREAVSDKQLEEMGIFYISSLHDPIKDADDYSRVLGSRRGDGGSWLDGFWGGPDREWGVNGAFAFVVPE